MCNSFTKCVIMCNLGPYKSTVTETTTCSNMVFKRICFIISSRKGKELLHLLVDERSQVRTAKLLVQSPLVPGLRWQARFSDSYLPAWFLELALYTDNIDSAPNTFSKYSQANTVEAFYESIIEPTLWKYDLERDTLSQAAHQGLARLWSPMHIALSRGDIPWLPDVASQLPVAASVFFSHHI